MRAERTG